MGTQALPVFPRVVGGELPLSPREAAGWLNGAEQDQAPVGALAQLFGGAQHTAVWLSYGRSALGVALDLCGVEPEHVVAVPSYQCGAVVRKIASRTPRWRGYPLEPSLAPKIDEGVEMGQVAQALVTCVFFGSAAIEARLETLAQRLRRRRASAWIIEDRVMCAPDPSAWPRVANRCDVAVLSFRKHYPVPDGALLLAYSSRARERLAEWRPRHRGQDVGMMGSLVRQKVRAKLQRYAWRSAAPLADDPARNGLTESIASEQALEATSDSRAGDGERATAASAGYLMRRPLAADATTLRRRLRSVVDALRGMAGRAMTVGLDDGGGVGVPVLVKAREAVRAKAAERGLFLPIHWPRFEGDMAESCPSAGRWYAEELTLPVGACQSEDDVSFLIHAFCDAVRRTSTASAPCIPM